jgi:hypothetical protein
MTKLRNIVGIAFVAMSLLTGLTITSAHAQIAQQGVQLEVFGPSCEYLLGYGDMCD